MTKIEAALAYASWGWHVIPVVPNGKVPATQHGVHDATTDPATITKWWEQNPEYNIGIAAGAKSGIVVFDIDPRNGGEDTWYDWTEKHGKAPDGAMQMTAGGGYHYLSLYDADIRSCKLDDGIDLLSDGRYFVAYPSTIEGRTYEWEGSSDPFDGVAPFVVPTVWLDAYRARKKQDKKTPTNAGGGLIQGSRNDGLTAMGGVMRRYGMTEAEIMAALTIANETRCEIPLPSSELAQIVRSVCRYEPESDVAASVAIGSEAADAILGAAKAEVDQGGYFFTRATSFLDQPAALSWIIKNWIYGVTMIYGESGAGKSFFALDIACHIAAGMKWNGLRTKEGTVVYMAGEGNYGIRQRVTAWCKYYGVKSLDRLIISNKAIDIDSAQAAAHIIGAVRELNEDNVVLLIVDTVNNHMAGDENSAQETRNMLNSLGIVSRALNAPAALTHHVGVSGDAKGRARGSSAWKASLDSQILVKKSGDVIEVVCAKMKDAAEPESIFARLEPVDLGWFDEDGDPITSAVFKIDSAHVKEKGESEFQKEIRKLSNAWFNSGTEERNGMPYVSRSALIEYLVSNEGNKESTAKIYIKESAKGRMIYNLLTAEIIQAYEHGWVVTNEAQASVMRMLKG